MIGNVWSTKRLEELPNGAFLEVEVDGGGERLVAFDVLGSGVGERCWSRTGRSPPPGSPASRRRSTR